MSPRVSQGPQKPKTLTASKTKYDFKKTLLIFFKLKQQNSYGLICVLASEAPHKAAGTKKMFSRSFHQYS